jgi:hypothetical protein
MQHASKCMVENQNQIPPEPSMNVRKDQCTDGVSMYLCFVWSCAVVFSCLSHLVLCRVVLCCLSLRFVLFVLSCENDID